MTEKEVEEILYMAAGQLLLLWPGGVRRKREGDFGQIGPALLAGTNNCASFLNKISSTSYCNSLFVSFLFKTPQNVRIETLKV